MAELADDGLAEFGMHVVTGNGERLCGPYVDLAGVRDVESLLSRN